MNSDAGEMTVDPQVTVLAERTGATLREHLERSEQQLHELEGLLADMLREHDTLQEDLDATRAHIENVRGDVQRTERAIARIESGTFGRCTTCGGPIAIARLEAIPEADRCSACA